MGCGRLGIVFCGIPEKEEVGLWEAGFPQRASPGKVACPCPPSSVSGIKARRGSYLLGKMCLFGLEICVISKNVSVWDSPSWILPRVTLARPTSCKVCGKWGAFSRAPWPHFAGFSKALRVPHLP